MDKETKYSYQKRIKELEKDVSRLESYRSVMIQIYDLCVTTLSDGDRFINTAAILSKARWLLK